MTDYDREIQELQDRLARLKGERDAEREERRKSVKPRYSFILAPYSSNHDRIADPSCAWYRLEGVVINADELHAVGVTQLHQGGMNYLYNTLSGRFVVSSGGGMVWLRLVPSFGSEAHTEAFAELEMFVQDHPEGGDVTEIVNRYREGSG